jgi:sulfotransferase
MKTFYFISGLPRSGSTLLSALLRQNPRFHAKVTSPLYAMVDRMVEVMSAQKRHSSFFDDERRACVLRGLFDSYYGSVSADVVFDTHRIWTANAAMLAVLFPATKIICCVRNVPNIIDSFERIIRKNPLQYSSLFGYANEPTIYGRVQALMSAREGLIGGPHSALRTIWFTELAKKLIVVRYENLASQPERTLQSLYQLLGEAPFAHDIVNVEAEEPIYDERIGLPGLHRVRRGVSLIEQPLTIPPDIFHSYSKLAFWNIREENVHNIPVL